MIQVLERNKCCGCGACYSACPKQAISMQLDDEGFEYPVVDQSLCIDCKLCQKKCPVLQYENRNGIRDKNCEAQVGFVAKNKNFSQRLNSSSGSVFPPIAEWVLDQKGLVVGAAYDDEFNAVHKIICDKAELPLLQGSKYLQIKTDGDTFKIIQKELLTGRKILYSGMACQVEALKSFLQKDFENLYTIDLICMGIPSYVVWQKYLKTFFSSECIKSVNFKEKSVGWDSFVFRVETDKRVFQERGKQNLYLQSMFRTWNLRPSCFQCPFKKKNRISDFTIADAWGVSKDFPQINDNKGLSSVIVHSLKGLRLWRELENHFDKYNVSIDDIAKGNSNLILNKVQMGKREAFYQMLERNPKRAFCKLCSERVSMASKILSKIKRLLCF